MLTVTIDQSEGISGADIPEQAVKKMLRCSGAPSLPSPRAFFAFIFSERLFTTISEPGTGYLRTKLVTQTKGLPAWPVINQLCFPERHFSANGISLRLGEVQMKIYERSLQALLSSAPRGFATRSRVHARLASLAQIGELAHRLKWSIHGSLHTRLSIRPCWGVRGAEILVYCWFSVSRHSK